MDSSAESDFKAELAALSDIEYLKLIKRLGLFAKDRVASKALTWQGVTGGQRLPKAQEIEDIVGLAIERAIEGKRKWNRTRYPTIEKFMRSVIRSSVNHLAETPENRLTAPGSLEWESEDDTDNGHSVSLSPQPSPRAYVEASEFLGKFKEGLDDDLLFLMMAFEDKLTKHAEIAAELGKPAEEIYNMKKRLKRKLIEFYKQQGIPLVTPKGAKK